MLLTPKICLVTRVTNHTLRAKKQLYSSDLSSIPGRKSCFEAERAFPPTNLTSYSCSCPQKASLTSISTQSLGHFERSMPRSRYWKWRSREKKKTALHGLTEKTHMLLLKSSFMMPMPESRPCSAASPNRPKTPKTRNRKSRRRSDGNCC